MKLSVLIAHELSRRAQFVYITTPPVHWHEKQRVGTIAREYYICCLPWKVSLWKLTIEKKTGWKTSQDVHIPF